MGILVKLTAGSDIGLERRGETQEEEEEEGEGYDHLDFARSQELKPHYHSTDTLRSSPQSAQSRCYPVQIRFSTFFFHPLIIRKTFLF